MGVASAPKKRSIAKRMVSWIEIPALELERAVSFYSHLYDVPFEIVHQGDYSMAMFPVKSGVGGSLVKGPGYVPNEYGTLVYLNAIEPIEVLLKRVEEAGGKIVMEESSINEEMGSFALFIDSEGNKLALHASS